MKRKHNNIKAGLSLVFAFLLTVLLVILFISFGLGIGVFNSRSIIKSINKTNYYDKVYVDISQRTEELLLQAGLPSTLLSDIITAGRVHADGMNYIKEATSKKHQAYTTDNRLSKNQAYTTDNRLSKNQPVITDNTLSQPQNTLYNDIKANILEHIEQIGIRQSSDLSKEITEVTDAIEYEYKSKIQMRFIEYLMSYKSEYGRLMIVMVPSLILLISVLCYMLIRVHRIIYRGIRYIVYALLASSLMTLAASLYLLLTKSYNKLMLAQDYYYQFMSEYIRLNIIVFTYIGMMGLIVAMALITLIGLMRNKIMNINN
ncbi:MAG: hypothetical protein EWM47_09310 [Anaerolineaceae bacterium]|nr:MAG: hypothetical protein EWM47_09310 [Anaerolineaceae bacterium]